MKTKAIIAAGGLGTRLKTVRPKPLVMLGGRPLFAHAVEVFERCPLIDGIILVTHEYHILDFEDVVKHYNYRKVERVVVGGSTRCDSVYNGLREIGASTQTVVIHDGARPLLKAQVLEEAVVQCGTYDAVIAAVPVKPTIKRVDREKGVVLETLDRRDLWEVQTPQVFKKDILLKAYAQRGEMEPTDDAGLVERLGVPVKVIQGDYANIKITTQEDLVIAEAFLKNLAKEQK